MNLLATLRDRAMLHSRQRKLEHFYRHFHEGMSVVDVGVGSEKRVGLRARNYFLKNFRYAPTFYTGLGVQDLDGMEELFPGKRFVRYDGRVFPFDGQEFDWAFSNAVIEHVGRDEDQLLFLNEMLRVAKKVFFTTPNKHFPVDSHTNCLFRHWYSPGFYAWCARNGLGWTMDNLYLFSYGRLDGLLRESDATSYRIHKNRYFGVPMTFTVLCQRHGE